MTELTARMALGNLVAILFGALAFFSCATGYDRERLNLRNEYRAECHRWSAQLPSSLPNQSDESEVGLSAQDLVAKRSQLYASAPKKLKDLTALEKSWNLPETADYCLEFSEPK